VTAVSDADGMHSPTALARALAEEFQQLAPEDQALVLALVARLRSPVPDGNEFPKDVPFMDFDE
jgi:hypothetical protein